MMGLPAHDVIKADVPAAEEGGALMANNVSFSGSAQSPSAQSPSAQSLPALPLSSLSAWHEKLGDAVSDLGNERFPQGLVNAIACVVPFKYAFLFLYRPKAGPVNLFSNIRTDRAKRGIKRFVEATYVLNPVYNAFLGGVTSGVHRITHLAPDAYRSSEVYRSLNARILQDEELGYRTPGWPEGQEELSLLFWSSHGEMLELSLSRPRSDGFSEPCEERLQAIFPLVERLLLIHLTKIKATTDQDFAKVPALDQLLRDFGAGKLTKRERQVAQLVLKGHSGEAIALSLGVSLPTVKSHRRNLYSKLNISTQQELFSLFLRLIPQSDN